MATRTVWAVALLVGWASAAAAADELNIGDPAPKLAVKEFLKGNPVAQFDKGKTYVVEFWATWCGPCRLTIPHLTKLQKDYKEVTFIGVSIWENDAKDVQPFMKEMGDKMDYRVAVDKVPEGGKGAEGAMAKAWMQAAAQEGIPTAFIVNGDGKVAWIGHPMEMDKPLADIVAGKWDLATVSAQFKREQAAKRKFNRLREHLVEALNSGDSKKVLKVIDGAVAEDPKMETILGPQKYLVLAGKDGDPDKAQAYGKRLVETVLKDEPNRLEELAWTIVGSEDKTKADPKQIKVALAAAQRAEEVTKGKDPSVIDTLARAYFFSGDVAKALEHQEKALKLAKGTALEKDEGMQKRLEEYKKAAKK
jgi:thiol-disulfide isomerase/thioredoxin